MLEGEQWGQGMRPTGHSDLSVRLKMRSNPNPWHPLQRPGGERHDRHSRIIFSESQLGMSWREEVRKRTKTP